MSFRAIMWAAVLCASAFGAAATGAGTEFTYQGELMIDGSLANGTHNLHFSLWNALNGGTQIGATITQNGVPVNDGRFSAELDFGADAFDNTARWLEIEVDDFILAPRQPMTRAPYSIQTRGIIVGDDGNVTLNSLVAVEGTVKIASPGGIDLILDADTNNSGEDQNARMVLRQDGGQVAGRVGFREGENRLEVMQEFADALVLGTNNQDRVWIAPDGFVGIGRTTPVTTAEAFGIYKPTSSFGGMYVQTDADGEPFYGYAAGGGADAYHYLDSATGNWRLNVGVLTRLTVAPDGSVGIGTTNPTHPLHIQGSDSFGLIFANNSNANGVAITGQNDLASNDDPAISGVNGGTTGIGLYGYCWSLSGLNIGVYGRSNSTTGYDFYAGGAGTNYGAASSRRWKHNIKPIPGALDKIAQLRGVYFDWDEEHGGQHDVGMIAEEVGKVLPEIVVYEANGVDASGMDYSKVSPLLVEAINALRAEKDAEIDELRARIEALERLTDKRASSVQEDSTQ